MAIPVHRPFMKRHDMDAVLQCLVADLVKGGETSAHLEDEVRQLFSARYALALRSFDDAINLLLKAWAAPEGTTVYLSALAHWRWAARILARGYRPVLLDVAQDGQPSSVPDDPEALMVLSQPAGTLGDLSAIEAAQGYLAIDASEGLLALPQEVSADFIVAATEVTDRLTTGGGAVLLGVRSRAGSAIKRAVSESEPFRLPDLNAALGVTQLKTLGKRLERVKAIAGRFVESLGGTRHRVFASGTVESRVWHGFPVVVDSPPKDVMQYAQKHGVEVVPMFSESCLSRAEQLELSTEGLEQALDLYRRTMRFPLYSGLSSTDIKQISRVLSSLP